MDHVAALGHEASAFYGAATDLRLPIPSCPGWDVSDLVWHIGYVHRFWRLIAEGVEDADGARAIERPERPAGADLVPWAEHETDRLLGALRELDPAAPRWNWSPEPNVGGWIPRRMAHETAVHRWDVENAVGGADPIGRDLAADGIDEYLHVFVPADDGYAGPAGILRLEATDAERDWTIRMTGPHPVVIDGGADPDATVEDGASELLLTLWGRHDATDRFLGALVEHTDRS